MKKQLLEEINRTREIMGLSRLILTEQISMLKFFIKSFNKSKNVWTALNKTVLKKYGKAAGAIPISKIGKADDMIEVLDEVMSKTIPMVRNNGQRMKSLFFDGGIDITEAQATLLGKSWTQGQDAFIVAVKGMAIKQAKIITNLSDVLIAGGVKNASGLQKPMIEALQKSIAKNIKNTDDLAGVLAEVGMTSDKIKKIISNIDEFGTVGVGKNLEEMFQICIQSPNYQSAMITALKESPEFNKRFANGLTKEDLGKLIGRNSDDAITTAIYKEFSEPKWLFTNKSLPPFSKWVYNKGASFFNLMFKTKWGKVFAYYIIGTLGINYFMDQKWAVFGKKKAALTPDLYLTVEDNPSYIKKFGGYTDEEALANAEKLNTAIKGNAFGPYDQQIVNLYEAMPSVLACSHVCYMWENEVDGTIGSLYKTLAEDMSINWFPRPFSDEVLGDITISDIKDIFETLTWSTSSSSASKADFKAELKKNWPTYHATLYDGTNDWYSRLSGPIDGDVLGVLLQSCAEGSSQEDCLRNMHPETFNGGFNTVRTSDSAVYTKTQPTEVKDASEEFFENWLTNIENSDEEPPTTLEKLYNMMLMQQQEGEDN